MARVLITAFRPYGPWRVNASWLTLVELTRDLPGEPEIVTRLYPVSFERGARRVLELYIEQDYTVRLLGEFQQVGQYIATLSSLPRRISVSRMQVTHPSAMEGAVGGGSAGPPPTEGEVAITLTITSYVVRAR